jgi:colanic acid biosynthesis glycosyl transferase WcaI
VRILLYGLNFAPELTGIGKYTGEMARWLAAQGHEVRVVTAPPYYPEWAVHDGYEATAYQRELWHGVHVVRCPLWVPTKASGLKRLIHLASFAISSFPVLLAQVRWKPDVVWTVEPALFGAPTALLTAAISRATSWLHVQDYEVDAAFAMGLLKGRFLRSLVLACERWLMRRFDKVSTISGRMLDLAAAKGIARDRLVHFPNWVDISAITPLDAPSAYREQLGIPDSAVVVLYSGNMGAKQGLEVLAGAAREMQPERDVVFVLCGNGAGRDELIRQCEGLQNVRFIPLQPVEKLNELLGMADIHVLPQRADAADLVLPSKLSGMLASGRPVIATAKSTTELGMVLQHSGAGELVEPEDPKELSRVIRALAADRERRRTMADRARKHAERELHASAILSRFERELAEACVLDEAVATRPY